jgi:hypothetical protein
VQVVQPVIREHEHQQDCMRMVGRVYLLDATREEQEAAKEGVRKALAALPIGATARELEKARDGWSCPTRQLSIYARAGPTGITKAGPAPRGGMESRSPPPPHRAVSPTGIQTRAN